MKREKEIKSLNSKVEQMKQEKLEKEEENVQQYFSYIMAVSFIDGGNRSTHGQRKPLSSPK
jgi:hypothetical protein